MFKIGEFSCFTRVSVKMLRHYDEIDLLKPAFVDPDSGYRYYTADQLPRLNRIILFKDLGFGLDQIAQLLRADLSSDEVRGVIKVKQTELRERIAADTQRLVHLDAALDHLDEADCLPKDAIIVRDVPMQTVASIRRRVDPSEISSLFDQVEAFAANHRARSLSPPLMIFHDTEFAEDQQDIAVAVPLTEPLPDEDDIRVYDLPGATMACIVYTGPYVNTDPLMRQYPQWLEANGYEQDGPPREVYLRFGAANTGYTLPDAYLTDTESAFVTELQLPIRRKHHAV